MVSVVKNNRIEVYVVSIFMLAISIIGIYKIEISGSFIDDMPRKTQFFDDIMYYEKEFNGILPLEIYSGPSTSQSTTSEKS